MNQTQGKPDSPGYVFDSYNTSGYTPDLYRSSGEAEGIDDFDDLTEGDVAGFHERGYLVVRGAFTEGETRAALEGMMDLIDGRNPEFRGLQFEASIRDRLPTMTREEKADAVRKLIRFIGYDPRLDALSTHPKLIGTLKRLMGEPPVLFANQAMITPVKP